MSELRNQFTLYDWKKYIYIFNSYFIIIMLFIMKSKLQNGLSE